MNAIEINNVTKEYRTFKLDHISLDIPSGAIMGFIGENGAGKTTTIKSILGLLKVDSGDIKIFGKDSKDFNKEIKEQIGVVLDECFFHDTLKGKDIDKIMKHIYRNWDQEQFEYYINKFRLPMDKSVKEYSRGMKMKLSIAVALSHHAKLLILDEPTSGLDPVIRNEIIDVFLDFIQDEEHTILVSSHITSDLEKIADYITFIHDGKIVLSKSKDELLEEYGVVKCKASEYEQIAQEEIVGYRQSSYGYEILVKDKKQIKKRYPELLVDPVNLEDIMVYYTRRER